VNHSKTVMKLLKQGQFSISRRHIEETRPWRGILVAHVRQTLQSGRLVSCNEASAVFQGHDLDGPTHDMIRRLVFRIRILLLKEKQ
jgi:hypothetical protein